MAEKKINEIKSPSNKLKYLSPSKLATFMTENVEETKAWEKSSISLAQSTAEALIKPTTHKKCHI